MREAQSLLARGSPAASRLDKALGPDLGQCCGGRVLLTIERFGAADKDAVAPLAKAERDGGLVTVATAGRDGRLARHVAAGSEGPSPGPAYEVKADGRVIERFGDEATPFYLFGAGHVGTRACASHLRRCRSPSPGSTAAPARFRRSAR